LKEYADTGKHKSGFGFIGGGGEGKEKSKKLERKKKIDKR
jgi:hypothetical protein